MRSCVKFAHVYIFKFYEAEEYNFSSFYIINLKTCIKIFLMVNFYENIEYMKNSKRVGIGFNQIWQPVEKMAKSTYLFPFKPVPSLKCPRLPQMGKLNYQGVNVSHLLYTTKYNLQSSSFTGIFKNSLIRCTNFS